MTRKPDPHRQASADLRGAMADLRTKGDQVQQGESVQTRGLRRTWTATCETCRLQVAAVGTYPQFLQGLRAKGWNVIELGPIGGQPTALTFCPKEAQ